MAWKALLGHVTCLSRSSPSRWAKVGKSRLLLQGQASRQVLGVGGGWGSSSVGIG